MTQDFKVKLGKVARTLECEDSEGCILFTFDVGEVGDKSICLEHHSLDRPRGPRYDAAFREAKRHLEARGYTVEIFGDPSN
jgi:hypothetical protein